MKLKLQCLFVLICVAIVVRSQMHIGTEGLIGFPDTVAMGDEITFGCYIVNHTGIDYGSIIKLYYSVDGDTVETPLIEYSFLPIINGDSIGIFVDNMIVSSPTWHLGSDVVVVWPVTAYGDGAALTYTVEVEDSSVVNAIENYSGEYYYYFNSFEETIYLRNADNLEAICIYNMAGKLLFTNPASEKLSLQNLQNGIYILYLRDRDGRTYTDKLLIF